MVLLIHDGGVALRLKVLQVMSSKFYVTSAKLKLAGPIRWRGGQMIQVAKSGI